MSIYDKPYAKSEINFSFELVHAGNDQFVYAIVTGEVPVEIQLKGSYFKKTVGIGVDVNMRLDVEELVVPVTGGVDAVEGTDFLSANLDREKSDDWESVSLLKDDVGTPLVVDRTGARNIFRNENVASKGVVEYSPNLDFKYRLKPNTSYLIISDILFGDNNGGSNSILYGTMREER